MQDSHTGSCSCGDVRELKGDVAATDKEDSPRQMLQFEKQFTRDGKFGARDLQIDRLGPGGNNDVRRLQYILTNFN